MSALHHLWPTAQTTDRPLDARVANPRRMALIRRLDLRAHLGDPDLDGILVGLADDCRVPVAAVTVVTPDRQTYVAEVGVGAPTSDVPDDMSLCAEVVRTGHPLVVADARADPAYSRNPLVADGTVACYAGQPLRVGGRVLGVLSMVDRQARVFTDRELGILHAQARLVEAVLRQRAAASCDLLTGVDTRIRLMERVSHELRRARWSGQPVGLLVLEVTGLADVNERHGSDAGDLVLQELADRMTAAAGSGEVG